MFASLTALPQQKRKITKITKVGLPLLLLCG